MSWVRDKRVISRLLIVQLILALGLFTLYPLEADGKRVRVRGYYRKDGTYVKPHYRTAPDSNPYNNYSYPGNYNPNTGKITPGDPQKYLDRYYNRKTSSSSSAEFNKWLKDLETKYQTNDSIKVRGYYRKDGTYVKPHYRTAPDGNPYNNYSYPGNYNPNTGKITTGDPLKYLEEYNSSQSMGFSSEVDNSDVYINDPDVYLEEYGPSQSNQTYDSQTQIEIRNGILENDGYFTVGSTMNEVVAVQGTPDSFSEGTFNYGSSRVYFRNGHVSSWNQGYTSLKAKLVPAQHTLNKGYFTVGSTKDEVITVQGTPDSFSEGTFNYGSSRVYFRNGHVSSWNQGYTSLKAKLVPAKSYPDSFSTKATLQLVPAQHTLNKGYFTVGSTKDEVITVQGTPDSFSEGTFNYGSSRVYFRNGHVSSWNQGYTSLKAKLVPAKYTPNKGYFTVGSTKDEVITVQGTPDSFSEGTFNYGSSRVYFRNGHVSSWNQGYTSLKAKLVPAKYTPNKGYFTVGSTKDEVITVQGTPDSFSEGTFNYGSSRVYFRNGRVSSWNQGYTSLKAKLVPAKYTPNKGYFTVGSTKDEVITVQGTPDSFSEGTFNYGSSRVYFRNGRVSSWNQGYTSLKVK